ncbi:MAG TPA: efflux RND transporter periplasmic adaptor subunit [Chitinophagaceae bacterium]|jgi:Cu(I)/Ag(I) efflux system membrane fusion protein|nr:efflux RND transporter periplasmic adaptor subunit [Chitinophagaceae bacterium]
MKKLNRQWTMCNWQIIIAYLFIGCFLLFVPFSCKNKKTVVTEGSVKKEQWTCSMHPEIIRDKPGTCPICGMELVKKVENTVAIHDIQVNDLLQPTDHFIISSIPVTTISQKSQAIEVEALGTVAYDTRLVNTISARVSGRIDKLYVRYRYQHIMKGQRIMDIYSPQLLTSEQELLFLIKNDANNSSLIYAAKQKLLLLGMSEAQVQQIIKTGKPSLAVAVYSPYSGHIHEAGNVMPGANAGEQKMDISRITEELPVKEGMYIEKGQNIFQVYNTSRSWVLLNIFPEYQTLIKTEDVVRIIPETAPNKNFRAKIDFMEPFFRKENKSLTARVYFDNSKLEIPIGSQVRATIFANSKVAEWLPKDAVLSLGIDKIVFLKIGGGFKAHKVETGLSYKNQVQILSGLDIADSVAANAQFLTDSESFIKINNQ